MIRLSEVTPDNWRTGQKVRNEQTAYVSDANGILARAYAYRNHRSRAYMIYRDTTPIGMAMYYDIEDAYNFSQFFIDARYQRRGYGYIAAGLVLREMAKDGKYDKVVLCYVEGDEAAEHLYLKLGFRHTGDDDGGEIGMEKMLR